MGMPSLKNFVRHSPLSL